MFWWILLILAWFMLRTIAHKVPQCLSNVLSLMATYEYARKMARYDEGLFTPHLPLSYLFKLRLMFSDET
jgi:hypothetical protein